VDVPKIVRAIPHEDYTVTVYFSDGMIVTYDVRSKLERGVFQSLKDLSFFINNCKIMNDTLAWDLTGKNDPTECIDIDPDYLYGLEHAQDPDMANDNGEHIVTEGKTNLTGYVGRGEKMFRSDAKDYVRGMRNDDRI
jgi:hypothetical protein